MQQPPAPRVAPQPLHPGHAMCSAVPGFSLHCTCSTQSSIRIPFCALHSAVVQPAPAYVVAPLLHMLPLLLLPWPPHPTSPLGRFPHPCPNHALLCTMYWCQPSILYLSVHCAADVPLPSCTDQFWASVQLVHKQTALTKPGNPPGNSACIEVQGLHMFAYSLQGGEIGAAMTCAWLAGSTAGSQAGML